MLIRLVRLTLHPASVAEFMALYDAAAPRIRAQEGCLGLELLADVRYPNIVTTYSRWKSAEALDAYRDSPFFDRTWRKTRELFAAPPEARSHVVVRPTDG